MFAVAKLVLLVLVAVLAFALSTEGRELLDYYDDCYNGARSHSSSWITVVQAANSQPCSMSVLRVHSFMSTFLYGGLHLGLLTFL